jgi:integrase
MLRSYEDAGLRLPPGAREFAQQGFLAAAGVPPSEQLSPEVVARILRILPKLRTVRPGIWACLVLMFRGGLRNSEAAKARWSWILPAIGGGFVLQLHTQGDYKPKAKDRIVLLSADVVELLRTIRPAAIEGSPKEDPHVVPAATDYARIEACTRGVNKVLRACGVRPVKGKIAYRLRGHAITEVILASGMEAAREFAGHTSTQTTEIYRGAAVPYLPLSLSATQP